MGSVCPHSPIYFWCHIVFGLNETIIYLVRFRISNVFHQFIVHDYGSSKCFDKSSNINVVLQSSLAQENYT